MTKQELREVAWLLEELVECSADRDPKLVADAFTLINELLEQTK